MAAGVAEPSTSASSGGLDGGAEEITLRYKCGGPPDGPASTSFYVLVYADRFLVGPGII